MPKRSLPVKFLVRVLVSVVLLAVIYGTTDLSGLLTTLSTLSWELAILIPALYALSQIISAWKWSFILQVVALRRSYRELLQAYFIGMYVNAFGLGTVGGDVVRGLAIRPEKGKRAAALASVVADRAQGLTVLAAMGAIAILLVRPSVLGPFGPILAFPLVLVLALGWWLGPKILIKLFPETHRFGEAAQKVALAFPNDFKTLGTITLISACFHTVQIFMHYFIALELGVPISLAYFFATVPLINIAASAPLSVNGLGIREAMYLWLLVPAGLSQEAAVAFGAIWIVSVTLVSAIGGFIAGAASSLDALDEISEEGAKGKESREVAQIDTASERSLG